MDFIEPCFGIGHSLSLICQMTSEDIKHQLIIIIIKRAVTTELRGIPEESFQQCAEAWQRRMEKCIRLEGDYFEGETM